MTIVTIVTIVAIVKARGQRPEARGRLRPEARGQRPEASNSDYIVFPSVFLEES